jgi:hypothetical protein
MKNIRQNIFETNSSSSHSLSISENTDGIYDTIDSDENGIIHVVGDCFGKQWDAHNDAITKISYCATDQQNHSKNLKLLAEVIKEQTCCTDVVFDFSKQDRFGNFIAEIDHQSTGTSDDLFLDKEKLRNFLFNSECAIIIGGNSQKPPPNIFDFGKNIKYRFYLKLDMDFINPYIYKFEKYPTKEELIFALDCLTYYNIFNDVILKRFNLFNYKCHYSNQNKNINSFCKIKEKIVILYKTDYFYNPLQLHIIDQKEIKFQIKKVKTK